MNHKIGIISPEDTWDLRHRVMWPERELDYVKLEEDKDGIHFGLEVEGDLRSIISVFVKDGKAQFRKFATDHSHQGKGYGSLLLEHVLKYLEQQGLDKIWCNARVEKTAFYEKFGLVKTDHRFEKGGLDYVIMEMEP
ncbi:GNAT family N-acetyltransferase [Echinicola sediminis]